LYVLLLPWVASPLIFAAETEVSIYIPPFDGLTGLARSVNTVVRLQIWQTLRTSGEQRDPAGSFGLGTVKWGQDRLPTLTYSAADTFAHHARILSQMVLFGAVQEYGDGVVLQAFLSLPSYKRLGSRYFADFREERPEVWIIRVPLANCFIEFQQDVPRRRLAFEPVILERAFVNRYSDLDAIIMYNPSRPEEPIGPAGDIIEALEQREGAALIRSQGRTGIVRLPELATHRSEIVDFVSGVVRVFRGDWPGALDLFSLVLKNPRIPTDIRIDTHLYRAMANAKLGRSTENDLQQALDLNPYAVRSVRYAIMSSLANVKQSMDRKEPLSKARLLIESTRCLIVRYRGLFLEQDPWLNHVEQGLSKIEASI
jgi:hypothetical protein